MARRKRGRATIPNSVVLANATGDTRTYHGAFVFRGREKSRAVAVQPLHFPCCPICFSTDELTAEHVPMAALGGTVMTSTCKPCNNILGSVAEEELRRAFNAEVVVRAEALGASSVRGPRRATAYLRRARGREPVLVLESSHREFVEVIESPGPKNVSYALLDPFLAEVALLKYSYLASCMRLQGIPRSPSADAVRAVLIAVRDGRIPEARNLIERVVRAWPFIRVENGHPVSPIILVEPTVTQPNWLFVLAGSIAVRWPLADINPGDGGSENDIH